MHTVKYPIIGYLYEDIHCYLLLIRLALMSSDELDVDYALWGMYLTYHKCREKNWKWVTCSLINKRENTKECYCLSEFLTIQVVV